MQSKTEFIKKVMLELNEQEARWLRALVQNPIGCTPEKEPESDRNMRANFWEALKSID
jgi:hypothetical protein